MVALADALRVLAPNAVPLVDFILSDDGKGSFLAAWNEKALGLQPDANTLAAVTQQQVDQLKAQQSGEATKLALFDSKADPATKALWAAIQSLQQQIFILQKEVGLPRVDGPALVAQLEATVDAGIEIPVSK